MSVDTLGPFNGTEEIVASASGSAYFDRVVEMFAPPWATSVAGRVSCAVDAMSPTTTDSVRRPPMVLDWKTPLSFRPAVKHSAGVGDIVIRGI